MLSLIKTKRNGLEVWLVRSAEGSAHVFFSEAGARTYLLLCEQKARLAQ